MHWVKSLFRDENKSERKKKVKHCFRRRRPFKNPFVSHSKRNLMGTILWALGYYKDPCKNVPIPKGFAYPNIHKPVEEADPQATWINHSTFMLKVWGLTFLTDPIWNNRCSPSKKIGPKRLHPPPFGIENIDHVDYVLISHNHYDHLDRDTILSLHKKFPNIQWLVPLGVKRWFLKLGIKHVIEMGWWQSIKWSDAKNTNVNMLAKCLPAQHFSGRYVWDYNRSLWCGWCIKLEKDGETKKIYFAGDTGYNAHDFKEINKQCGKMDISLIPIGAYLPREFMRSVHMNPSEAVQVHLEVESKLSIAGHWGTFRLSSEGEKRPPFDLFLSMESRGVSLDTFRVLKPGQSINW